MQSLRYARVVICCLATCSHESTLSKSATDPGRPETSVNLRRSQTRMAYMDAIPLLLLYGATLQYLSLSLSLFPPCFSLNCADKNISSFFTFCRRAITRLGQHERETWKIMKMLFTDDARRHLLAHLGYSTDDVDKVLRNAHGKPICWASFLLAPLDLELSQKS